MKRLLNKDEKQLLCGVKKSFENFIGLIDRFDRTQKKLESIADQLGVEGIELVTKKDGTIVDYSYFKPHIENIERSIRLIKETFKDEK